MAFAEAPIIAEGKTKIIRAIPDTADVYITSKDDITAGDGEKRDLLTNKGILSTETTSNCFKLLNISGIPTHFIERVDNTTFRARNMEMIPIELVARRIATGSYLKRNPEILEGEIFNSLMLEFFIKDDLNHDPMVIYDFVGRRALFYQASKPMKEGFMGETFLSNLWERSAVVEDLTRMTSKVFEILEIAWEAQNVTLVDLKIECGWDRETEELLVADVIDNDSWRIWPVGDKSHMRDKQVYRNLEVVTLDALNAIRRNYEWVADATKRFI